MKGDSHQEDETFAFQWFCLHVVVVRFGVDGEASAAWRSYQMESGRVCTFKSFLRFIGFEIRAVLGM